MQYLRFIHHRLGGLGKRRCALDLSPETLQEFNQSVSPLVRSLSRECPGECVESFHDGFQGKSTAHTGKGFSQFRAARFISCARKRNGITRLRGISLHSRLPLPVPQVANRSYENILETSMYLVVLTTVHSRTQPRAAQKSRPALPGVFKMLWVPARCQLINVDTDRGACCVTQCFPYNVARWRLFRAISEKAASQKAQHVRLLGAWQLLRDTRAEHRVARLQTKPGYEQALDHWARNASSCPRAIADTHSMRTRFRYTFSRSSRTASTSEIRSESFPAMRKIRLPIALATSSRDSLYKPCLRERNLLTRR